MTPCGTIHKQLQGFSRVNNWTVMPDICMVAWSTSHRKLDGCLSVWDTMYSGQVTNITSTTWPYKKNLNTLMQHTLLIVFSSPIKQSPL